MVLRSQARHRILAGSLLILIGIIVGDRSALHQAALGAGDLVLTAEAPLKDACFEVER